MKQEAAEMIMTIISRTVLLLVLAGAAFMDVRDLSLPIWFITAAGVVGTTLQLISGQVLFYEILLGLIPGLCMLGVSFLSRRSVGLGDALMMTVAGTFLGFSDTVWLMLASFSICALASLYLMIFLKKKGRSTIPFMPFMLSGYICIAAFI